MRVAPGTLEPNAGRGRDRGGTSATACPIPRPPGTSAPWRDPRCWRGARGSGACAVRAADDRHRGRVLPDHQDNQMASFVAAGAGGGRGGVDRGGGPQGRGRGVRRGTRPGRELSRCQRPSGQPPAAFHGRVRRDGYLAAAAASGRCPRGRRRGGPGGLAELAAYRRAERASGASRADRGRPPGRDRAGDPGRRRGDQGRRMPGGRSGLRRAGGGVVVRGGRRDIRVRLGRAGRADHELSAGVRRGPAPQAGPRGGPHRRSRPAGKTGRGLRRG